MALNITKTGILLNTNLNEYHVEPDGSTWEHIFHHNRPPQNLFSSGDTFITGIYKNDNAWFNFQICNSLSTWEFLLIQQQENYSPIYKFRWIQTKNPLTAAYADVAAGSITKNTSTGYTSFSTGGLYKINNSTYLCTNNGNSGNWWGAVGAWSSHASGIPAWNRTVVITGFIDVYVRVDSINKNAKFYKTNLQVCNNFYEY